MGKASDTNTSSTKMDAAVDPAQWKEAQLTAPANDAPLPGEQQLRHHLKHQNSRLLSWKKAAWVVVFVLCTAATIRHFSSPRKTPLMSSDKPRKGSEAKIGVDLPPESGDRQKLEEQKQEQQEQMQLGEQDLDRNEQPQGHDQRMRNEQDQSEDDSEEEEQGEYQQGEGDEDQELDEAYQGVEGKGKQKKRKKEEQEHKQLEEQQQDQDEDSQEEEEDEEWGEDEQEQDEWLNGGSIKRGGKGDPKDKEEGSNMRGAGKGRRKKGPRSDDETQEKQETTSGDNPMEEGPGEEDGMSDAEKEDSYQQEEDEETATEGDAEESDDLEVDGMDDDDDSGDEKGEDAGKSSSGQQIQALGPEDSILEHLTPVFVSARPSDGTQCAKDKIVTEAAEAVHMLEEEAGKEAADAFIKLLTQKVPTEDPTQLSSDVLKSVLVERAKQKAAVSALRAFQARRSREEALARVMLQEQMLRGIKDHVEKGLPLPTLFTEMLGNIECPLDLKKETAVFEAAQRQYEESLATESGALQVLMFDMMDVGAHFLSADIFVRAANIPAEWKTKLPKYGDLATALTDIRGIAQPNNMIHVPGMASTMVEATKATLGDKNSAVHRVGRLLQLVETRKRAHSGFKLCADPQLDNSTEKMALGARRRAFEL
ncbi:hypothetical protein, conserved, partial [Eimeria acervulina]